jgi:hypothetical protein
LNHIAYAPPEVPDADHPARRGGFCGHVSRQSHLSWAVVLNDATWEYVKGGAQLWAASADMDLKFQYKRNP